MSVVGIQVYGKAVLFPNAANQRADLVDADEVALALRDTHRTGTLTSRATEYTAFSATKSEILKCPTATFCWSASDRICCNGFMLPSSETSLARRIPFRSCIDRKST